MAFPASKETPEALLGGWQLWPAGEWCFCTLEKVMDRAAWKDWDWAAPFTKCQVKPKNFHTIRVILAVILWRQGCVGNLSLLCVAGFCPGVRFCTNCISGKDFNFFPGKHLVLFHVLVASLWVSVCDWQRRGDLVKRDLDWNLLQLFGCLTGDVYFWLLNKISGYKMKIGH